MQITTNFSLEEFTATQHRHIDNTIPTDLLDKAKETCEMLERIRIHLSIKSRKQVRIYITSGYRSRELNTAVGGQPSSDHVRALAADWIAPKFGTPYEIAKFLAPDVYKLGIGQLIREFADRSGSGWIHTSTRVPNLANNRIITIDRNGTRLGVA